MILLSVIAISVSLMLLVHFMSKKHEAQQKAKARQRNSSPSLQPQPPSEKTLPGIERVTTWLDTLKKFREGYTWADNVVIGVIALALIHIGAGIIFESNYGAYMWRKEVIFFQVAMGVGFSMLAKKKDAKPPRHILGVLVILMAIIVTGKMFFSSNKKDNPPSSTNAQAATRGGNNTALAPLTRSSFEMESKPCLEHDGLKGVDSKQIREALKGYPGLLSISCRESKLDHRDPEDTSKILVGKIDPRDLGFLQINTHYHPPAKVEKVAGCTDLKEFSCSEKYGKKLYDEHGLEPWFPHGPNESGRQYAPFTVTDTAGVDFGPRINIPKITRETRFDVTTPVIVEVEYDSGEKKEFTLTPNKFTDMGISVKWFRFKRTPDATENGKVTITYTFYKVP